MAVFATRSAHLRKERPSIIAVVLFIAALVTFFLGFNSYEASRSLASSVPVHPHVPTQEPQSTQRETKSLDDTQSVHILDSIAESKAGLEPTTQKTCFERFPWVAPALEDFYAPAREAFNTSTQTTEQALASMDEITWVDGYHPGHDLITLRYNETLGRYDLTADISFPPNQPYKRECILPPLLLAMEQHGAELAEKFGRKDLKFVVGTEDFGMTWRNAGYKLPAFSLCTDSAHIDIPVPDFTFGCYPEASYDHSSWQNISSLLELKSKMIPWGKRENSIFHRSNWGVGPRKGLMPFLKDFEVNGTDVSTFGAALDIKNTEFSVSNRKKFVWLDEQCKYKVAIHTAGFSYSAGLKYKLACGQLVLKFESDFTEFYEPALKDGVHVVKLPAGPDGVDEIEFVRESG